MLGAALIRRSPGNLTFVPPRCEQIARTLQPSKMIAEEAPPARAQSSIAWTARRFVFQAKSRALRAGVPAKLKLLISFLQVSRRHPSAREPNPHLSELLQATCQPEIEA